MYNSYTFLLISIEFADYYFTGKKTTCIRL